VTLIESRRVGCFVALALVACASFIWIATAAGVWSPLELEPKGAIHADAGR
jgi:hypothetical protein